MIELCGASIAPGTIDVGGVPPAPAADPPAQRAGPRDPRGGGDARAPARRSSAALDFDVQPAEDGLRRDARPPVRRNDVTREVDLIEEVARIDGLERLPTTLPGEARRGRAPDPRPARAPRAPRTLLAGRGLHEIVGWSFADPGLLDRLRLPADARAAPRVVRLENPLSEDHSIMRPTLLGSLLDAARHNAHRNGPDLALFESGTVYRAREDGAAAPTNTTPSGRS